MVLGHARQKVVSIAPSNSGIRLQRVDFGKHEWPRFDDQINKGTTENPQWIGAYHWSIRNNSAWWGCSID
jgi:hypothetical protein